MKPKIIQCDKRGQVVIPKNIRDKLSIDESGAFWIYMKNNEIVLKKIKEPKL